MDEKIQFRQIQILRAIAILMVIIHHTINNLPDSTLGRYLLILVNADVNIFFVISGYLFEKGYERYKRDVRGFLLRKAGQLLVPYLFWSLLLYAGARFAYDVVGGKAAGILQSFGFARLSWGTIAFNILTFQDYYVEYLWFIYVLFFFFVVSIFTGRKTNHWWMIIAVLLFASTMNYFFALPTLLWKFLQHYSDFLIGRLIFSKRKLLKSKLTYIVSLVCMAASFTVVLVFQDMDADFLSVSWGITLAKHILYWSVCAICYLIAGIVVKTRCSPTAECVGNYSYDIYLMHTPYIVPIAANMIMSVSGNWIISFLVTIGLGISVPLLISKFVIRKLPVIRTVALGK